MTNKKTPENTPKEETPKDTPKTEPTKPTVSTDSPKTGDDANINLWMAFAGIAALAGVGFTTASVVSKKRKKGK